MQANAAYAPIVALLGFGADETFLVLVIVLLLLFSKQLPDFARGLRQGIDEFRKASDKVGFDLGRNLGGIYGTPDAAAFTPENRTFEIPDPAELRNRESAGKPGSQKLAFTLAGMIFLVAVFWVFVCYLFNN